MPQDNKNLSTLNELLKSSPGILSKINGHVSRILSCQDILRTELGLPLSEHLTVANLSEHTLTLHTDNPAWASRLRFNIRTILNIAKNNCHLHDLKSVRIKVVLQNSDSNSHKRPLVLSDNTANMIDNTAYLINDHKLRVSLSSLSKHRLNR